MGRMLILTTLAVVAMTGTAEAAFAPEAGSPYAVGARPQTVATADFNLDGRPDIAAVNSSAASVSVLLRNAAAPRFTQEGTPYAVGSSPSGITTAQLNADAAPDLAVANFGANTVSILLRSSGKFTSTTVSVASPVAVAPADFDGDGDTDLAVSTYTNPGKIVVLRNSGTGIFTAEPTPTATGGSSARFAAVADFNADGRPDLAVTNFGSGSVGILIRQAAGGFVLESAPVIGTQAAEVVARDFNDDGRPDLAVTDYGAGSVVVLLRKATGGFMQEGGPIAVGSNPFAIDSADLNSDGRPDLVVGNGGSSTLTVSLRSASGGFVADPSSPIASDGGAADVALADFDGDKRIDIGVTNDAKNRVAILQNTSDLGAPITSIDATPRLINVRQPFFTFAANEPSTFRCAIDGTQAPCYSPFTTSLLSDGAHNLTVTATDTSGNVDKTPPSRAFSIDTKAPSTTIKSGPSVSNSKATFTWTADEDVTFACRVDGAAPTACTSPLTTGTLADGPHTFEVKATDLAGNAEAVPPQRPFAVGGAAAPAASK